MKQQGLSPSALRGILSTMIVLLIGLASVGFYFAQQWLQEYAVTVSHKVADSAASGTDVQALSKLQEELKSREDVTIKTANMFASLQTFQTQAVKDLGIYAAASGISISQFNFSESTVAPVGSGIPTTTVTITLASPVNYVNLLKFVQAIEGNLPKMQISGLNLSRIEGDTQSVKIDQLTIAVYTR